MTHPENAETDAFVKRAVADAIVERASRELRKLLQELAAALKPFPSFAGASSIQAIEIEPPRAASPENGCIVVCPDGELRELVLRMIPGPVDVGGIDQVDEFKELDLPPGEFVAYAHAAVQELARILEKRQQS